MNISKGTLLLVDDDPAILMPYNPPYYADQFDAFGLSKVKDLFALEVRADEYAGQLDKLADKLLARGRIAIRPVNLRRWHEELEFVRRCYNEAWARNWGFVPWTDRELAAIAKELKPLIDPRLAFVGEVDGQQAAISIAVPDANEALKLAQGRLLPLGLAKILWRVKVVGCRRMRVLALGVLPKYRRLGLDALLIQRTIQNGIPLGYERAEVGWILEDNEAIKFVQDGMIRVPDGEHLVALDPATPFGTSETLISESAIRAMYRHWRAVMGL
jgi:GNAT superfamily N-acetyltransferase